MDYDVVIVGGGLAGLYIAYKLPKHLNILLLEKRSLGGKIFTYKDTVMTVEAGAARFNDSHTLLKKLISEFNLSDQIVPIDSDFIYKPTNGPVSDKMKHLLKKILKSNIPKTTSINFLQYAKKVLSEQDAIDFFYSFGYSAELTIMNAKDVCNLMKDYMREFYVLKGGLSQIIECLKAKLKLKRVSIHFEEALHVSQQENSFIVSTATKRYECGTCVLAVPRNALEKFDVVPPDTLDFIQSSPLCRIYTEFVGNPKDFEQKFTTNNDLRMVIPMNEKIVMIYSDSGYATIWKHIFDTKGLHGINAELRRQFSQLGIKVHFKNTQLFYWPSGVGYWGLKANSKALEKAILQPDKKNRLFVCGENYSSEKQQWMEGALETATKVIACITNPTKNKTIKKKKEKRIMSSF